MQENGLINIRKGTAGFGHRPERHDRDGLLVGDVRAVLPEDQRSFHQLQDPAAIDGRHLEDHDPAERYLAAGL